MLSIGELARRTRISVRRLRHYDALGLVVPHRVDPSSGYRWYAPSQIGRVDSLVALRELGFTLDQCRAMLAERVSIDELRGMLGCGGPSWRSRSRPTPPGSRMSSAGSDRSRGA